MDLDDVYEILSLEILPDEILFDILLRLDIPELHSLSMVSPQQNLGKDDTNRVSRFTDMSSSTSSRYRPISP